MVKFFQVPEVSGVHSVVQVEPALNTSPGPGAEGVTPVARSLNWTVGTAEAVMADAMASTRAAEVVEGAIIVNRIDCLVEGEGFGE